MSRILPVFSFFRAGCCSKLSAAVASNKSCTYESTFIDSMRRSITSFPSMVSLNSALDTCISPASVLPRSLPMLIFPNQLSLDVTETLSKSWSFLEHVISEVTPLISV
ncbi:hypothetical protein B0H14DRAFT_1060701 [Mycena olivaceomarginata]|nr:hypothetical protein B0H14DRAFT_1060701 [Mycena olivaceomarginata]